MLAWLGSAEKRPQRGNLRMCLTQGADPGELTDAWTGAVVWGLCLQAEQGARLGQMRCCNRTESWGCGSLQ